MNIHTKVAATARDPIAALLDAPEGAVLAVIAVESAGRPAAVSHARAVGLMQLMPATAARFGVADRRVPDENIRGGVAYLDALDTDLAHYTVLAAPPIEGPVCEIFGKPVAITFQYLPGSDVLRVHTRMLSLSFDGGTASFDVEEVEGRKLMPVFLFRTPEQYYAYYSKRAGIPLDKARRSKGHAWLDYYATWYEAPNDPVHIHEATHQIFGNRLNLSGGGSWLQEGVAEDRVNVTGNTVVDAVRALARAGVPIANRELGEIIESTEETNRVASLGR